MEGYTIHAGPGHWPWYGTRVSSRPFANPPISMPLTLKSAPIAPLLMKVIEEILPDIIDHNCIWPHLPHIFAFCTSISNCKKTFYSLLEIKEERSLVNKTIQRFT